MTSVYWLEDPKILFDKENITELWPSSDMTYIEKMNTLCRLIIFLTLIGLIIFRSLSILIIGLIVLCVLTYIYNKKLLNDTSSKIYTKEDYNNSKKNINNKSNSKKENFDNMAPWVNHGELANDDSSDSSSDSGSDSDSDSDDEKDKKIKNPLNNHLVSDSIGAENKITKKRSLINNTKLSNKVRHNSNLINKIKLQKDLEGKFTLDRNLRNFYKVPDYDKSTIQYLTGNSATVKDNIFIKKDENFIQ